MLTAITVNNKIYNNTKISRSFILMISKGFYIDKVQPGAGGSHL
jgi:hypothetical protein